MTDTNTTNPAAASIRCHYEVLGVHLDADDGTIKKAHRKLALQYHPDKNTATATTNHTDNANDATSTLEKFRLVQEAYECLSDPVERRWYDDHREAILKGWSANNSGEEASDLDILFDIVHLMHPSCYHGYDDEINNDISFWNVYRTAFATINERELNNEFPDFGSAASSWNDVVGPFYQAWESFNSSVLSFAWADEYDTSSSNTGDLNRQVKRAMQDANLKARKLARKARNSDVRALVAFVKKRDPRVKARLAEQEQKRLQQQRQHQQQAARRKELALEARREWKERAEQEMAAAEEEDRLAGRIRLADLEDEDYDYGGKKNKKKKNKGKNKKQQLAESSSESDKEAVEEEKDNDTDRGGEAADVSTEQENDEDLTTGSKQAHQQTAAAVVDDSGTTTLLSEEEGELSSSEEEEEEDEPDFWRCECCRKDFKSKGQMENHFQSKKHKQTFKAYQAKKAPE